MMKHRSEAEREVWNAALNAAVAVTEDERGSREAFSPESAEAWDAACDWLGKRIAALRQAAS